MSEEVVKMAQDLEKIHGLSPAKTFQLAVVVRNRQYLYAEALLDEEKKNEKEKLEEVQNKLKKVIDSYGGIVVIDDWLTEHDTHQLLREIKDMDWTFLSEE